MLQLPQRIAAEFTEQVKEGFRCLSLKDKLTKQSPAVVTAYCTYVELIILL